MRAGIPHDAAPRRRASARATTRCWRGCAGSPTTPAPTARPARSGSTASTCAPRRRSAAGGRRRRCSRKAPGSGRRCARWPRRTPSGWRSSPTRSTPPSARCLRRAASASCCRSATRRRSTRTRRRSCSTACRTPATSAACCAARRRSASRRCWRSKARRRCGRPRCCAPAWGRTSRCASSSGSTSPRWPALAVPLVATDPHAGAGAARRRRCPHPAPGCSATKGRACCPDARARCAAGGAHSAAGRRGVAQRRGGGGGMPVRVGAARRGVSAGAGQADPPVPRRRLCLCRRRSRRATPASPSRPSVHADPCSRPGGTWNACASPQCGPVNHSRSQGRRWGATWEDCPVSSSARGGRRCAAADGSAHGATASTPTGGARCAHRSCAGGRAAGPIPPGAGSPALRQHRSAWPACLAGRGNGQWAMAGLFIVSSPPFGGAAARLVSSWAAARGECGMPFVRRYSSAVFAYRHPQFQPESPWIPRRYFCPQPNSEAPTSPRRRSGPARGSRCSSPAITRPPPSARWCATSAPRCPAH